MLFTKHIRNEQSERETVGFHTLNYWLMMLKKRRETCIWTAYTMTGMSKMEIFSLKKK